MMRLRKDKQLEKGEVQMQMEFEIPEGVDVSIDDKTVVVKGPKGTMTRTFADPRYDVAFVKDGNKVIVRTASERRKQKALAGTLLAHLRNMALGVTKGYTYRMKIFYTHFPITAEVKGDKVLVKNLLGERVVRAAKIAKGVTVKVSKDEITLAGISKEDVSQSSANIERACRLSKKDRRVFLDGIYMAGSSEGMEEKKQQSEKKN